MRRTLTVDSATAHVIRTHMAAFRHPIGRIEELATELGLVADRSVER